MYMSGEQEVLFKVLLRHMMPNQSTLDQNVWWLIDICQNAQQQNQIFTKCLVNSRHCVNLQQYKGKHGFMFSEAHEMQKHEI